MACLWEIMCVLNDTLRALRQLFSFMIISGLFDGRLCVCVCVCLAQNVGNAPLPRVPIGRLLLLSGVLAPPARAGPEAVAATKAVQAHPKS